ncbi:calpain-like cysteine peptidase [Trypanosoma theileri]|uniref:Calpain-like cysteine peptidase n=1 Tax=Trypanosoma theileri TaxID=67003 RepID=A0A1X0P7A0_9TRYP|nr:calpain-like cysteine peptidase [Trypanosoma theileri]ORC92701.1 calpain-like cysteine peptidase [Trypanosoma theileri]
MILATVLDDYRKICRDMGITPLKELEKSLAISPDQIDLSSSLISSSHFEAILRLIQERSEIDKLDFSGIHLSTSQLIRLFSLLEECCIRKLVLRNMELDVKSGEALKKLSMECKDLIEIDLTNTILPEFIEYIIMERIKLNKIEYEKNIQCEQKAVGPEASNLWRWRLESWSEENSTKMTPTSKSLQDSYSLRNLLRKVIEQQTLFSDNEFPPELAIKDSNISWIRVNTLIQDKKKLDNCCVGGSPLSSSVINDTRNLSAALNIVQQIPYLRKYISLRQVPDVGFFAFRFFINDSPITVIIDDMIPFKNGTPAGIHHIEDNVDYWGSLVEKAFAKIHGGYDNIAGVGFDYALSVLTGGVCFEVDWNILKQHFNESEMFRFIRHLINAKKVISTLCIPRNEMVKNSLMEIGICPNMSYLVTAVEAIRDENPYLSYAVQLSYPSKTKYKDAICISQLNNDNFLVPPRFWMGLEYCLTYFERFCLLLWPYGDPLNNHKIVMEYSCDCYGGSDYTSTFAKNPSFLLSNPGSSRLEIMLVLRKKDEDKKNSENWIQMHIHKASDSENELVRRYDVCARNELLSTRKGYKGEIALVIRLRENERVQLTTSAFSKCNCVLRATCVEKFQLQPLPSHYAYTLKGKWSKDSVVKPSLSLTNNSKEKVKKLVVVLSQEPVNQRLVSIGIQVWLKNDLELEDKEPFLVTEFRTDVVVVFRIEIEMKPDDSIVIFPLRKRKVGDVNFSLSVYSRFSLDVNNG